MDRTRSVRVEGSGEERARCKAESVGDGEGSGEVEEKGGLVASVMWVMQGSCVGDTVVDALGMLIEKVSSVGESTIGDATGSV